MPSPLTSIPYFQFLSPSEAEAVGHRLREVPFTKDELILMEGQSSPGVYIMKSGLVKIFKTSSDGREQVLHMMGPGNLFNEVTVFDDGPNPASAMAMLPSTLYLLGKKDLLELVKQYPSLAMGMLKVFSVHLRYLLDLVEDLSFRRVTGRVAHLLLQYGGEELGGEGVRLTQEQMASMVGTAREMVGKALRSLESQGAIRAEGRQIVILDRLSLQKMV